jgi:triphosphoribosyl-dephospho-CoA synthase
MSEPDYCPGLYAQLACIWEATARKPGNVHRFRDFADTSYLDFITSAAAMAPVIAVAQQYSVGATVSDIVHRSREVCPRNTNLGIALLLAPLAKASPLPDYRGNVRAVLDEMDTGGAEDVFDVYHAIRIAQPGGLGESAEQDVHHDPTLKLLDCMALAQERDLIARQYVNGFADVFVEAAPAIMAGIDRTGCLEGGIIHAHLHLMATFPDSLIARKRGGAEARESAERARAVLAAGWPASESGRKAIIELDDWLRAESNTRNPGTTADLIASALFVLLRTLQLRPGKMPWALREGAAL